MLSTLKKILHLAGPRRGKLWILLVAFSVVVGILEMTGALLIFGLLSLLLDNSTLELPLVGDIRALSGLDERSFLLAASALVAIFFVLRGGLFVFQAYVQNRVVHNAGVRLSTRLMNGYLRMPYSFHLQRNSSALIRNIYASTTELVSLVFLPSLDLTSHSLLTLALVTALLFTSPLATAIAAAFMVPMVLFLLRTVQPRMRALGKTMHAMNEATLRSLQEGLQGVRDVKILRREDYFVQRFSSARALQARSQYMRGVLFEVPRVMTEVTLIVFVVLFLALTVASGKNIGESLAVLGLVGYAGLRILPSVNRIVASINSLRFNSAALNHIYDEIRLLEGASKPAEPSVLLSFDRMIRCEGITFSFEGTDEPVLRNVSLEIAKGDFIGIVGGTGSGKSTLLDLIMGLLDSDDGEVLVDGASIAGRQQAWQKNLGVVPQAPFLLDGSLRENIALGLDPSEVDQNRIDMALRTAQLKAFVDELPDGLDTVIGERGVRISGGQRQRIAIARALYSQPKVLLFDEATSALDNVTERELVSALHELPGDSTIVMVAHRLTTVQGCDRIFVMEKGAVVDSGTYDELVTRSALFRSVEM